MQTETTMAQDRGRLRPHRHRGGAIPWLRPLPPVVGPSGHGEARDCPNDRCGHVDREPRDPAKKLLGFHAYRRKWATERKHLPVKDVAEAGGWLDTRSLQECYQHADEATLLQVVSETRKLRETIAAASAGMQ